MSHNPNIVGDAGTEPLRPPSPVLEGDGLDSEADPRPITKLLQHYSSSSKQKFMPFFVLPPVVATSSPLAHIVEPIQRKELSPDNGVAVGKLGTRGKNAQPNSYEMPAPEPIYPIAATCGRLDLTTQADKYLKCRSFARYST